MVDGGWRKGRQSAAGVWPITGRDVIRSADAQRRDDVTLVMERPTVAIGQTPGPPGRIESVDVVRGLACLWVMFHHKLPVLALAGPTAGVEPGGAGGRPGLPRRPRVPGRVWVRAVLPGRPPAPGPRRPGHGRAVPGPPGPPHPAAVLRGVGAVLPRVPVARRPRAAGPADAVVGGLSPDHAVQRRPGQRRQHQRVVLVAGAGVAAVRDVPAAGVGAAAAAGGGWPASSG